MTTTKGMRHLEMDAESISGFLKKADIPNDLTRDLLWNSIVIMTEGARIRMSANECGGLPGPVFGKPTTARRIMHFLEKHRGEN